MKFSTKLPRRISRIRRTLRYTQGLSDPRDTPRDITAVTPGKIVAGFPRCHPRCRLSTAQATLRDAVDCPRRN